MRVVQLANFISPTSGGIARTIAALRKGYAARGVDTILIRPGPAFDREIGPHGLTIAISSPVVPGTGGYRMITNLRAVRRTLDEVRPDRLEVHDRSTLRGLGDWAASAGVPSTMVVHERLDRLADQYLPWLIRPALMARRDNRRTAARFDRVVVPSAWARQEFAADLPVEVVDWGVDVDQFHPRHRSPVVGRRLRDGHDVLLAMVVRLSPEKQAGSALDALAVLRQQGVDAHLVIAGTGSSERALRRQARDLPVTFLGHLSSRQHVAEVLAAADVAICPGPLETFGLTALEALACGTPVVSSQSGALADILQEPFGASAYNHGHAMAGAITQLLSGADEARAAARAAAEPFTWDRAVTRMLAIHGHVPAAPEEALRRG
ncbi:glycosyltransferase [Euzebya tangerina]|uniref:glycosyltransferase n=1 Tax=Euzebya tangerina TaxID=591198 RepID=UPI000E31DA53|nr:glycosyltransferase [Euzebya tangerina]